MKTTIRGLKGLIVLGALAGLGLLLHWVTAGSIEAATAQDLTSMASLAIGAVAWVAYCWLAVAVLATVLEQVPGAVGRSASLVAGRITSTGSRALLRSALGVAAVTPLTIGMAHATPAHTLATHQSATPQAGAGTTPHAGTTLSASTISGPSTTSGHEASTRAWATAEPQSTVDLRPTSPRTTPTPTGSRPWDSTEPRSTVEVTAVSPTSPTLPVAPVAPGNQLASGSPVASGSQVASGSPVASGGSGLAGPQGADPRASQTVARPAGSRPWSSTEPRSTVEVSDGTPADWRSTEKPSSVQLGVPGTPAGSGKTDQPAQPAQPAGRSGAALGRHTPATRNAVPEKAVPEKTGQAGAGRTGAPGTGLTGAPGTGRNTTGRAGVPEIGQHATGRTGLPETRRGASEPGGRIAVPDRPSSGAPTRYTHLQSGQLARAGSHVVKAGESLWSIAAAELGPNATTEAIAGRWPQWYEANRQLIGPNPNLIVPGQVLNPPAPGHPVPPTHQEK